MEEQALGEVFDYYSKVGVIALTLHFPLSVGDRIRIVGKQGTFEQTVDSMQMEHKAVTKAKIGDDVGIKVLQPCKKGDAVFRLEE